MLGQNSETEPPKLRVSAEARGKLRTWKAAAAERYRQFNKVYDAPKLSNIIHEYVMRGSRTGKLRALDKICRWFGPVAVFQTASSCKHPVACWLMLRPRRGVLVDPHSPSLAQDCVAVDYLIVGRYDGYDVLRRATGLWSLEFSDHALGRLLMRSRAVDLDRAMTEAHYYLMSLPTHRPGIDFGQLWLRGGPGWFVGELRIGRDTTLDGDIMTHVRALTWMHEDQLNDNKERLAAQCQPALPLCERMADRWLLPAPLRRIEKAKIEGKPKYEVVKVAPNTLPPLPGWSPKP